MSDERAGAAGLRGRGLHAARPWLVAGVVLTALALMLRDVNGARLLEILRRADLRFVGLAMAINLALNTWTRIERRLALLRSAEPDVALDRRAVGGIYLASTAANSLMPARAGDLLFGLELRRAAGFPLASALAAQVLEKGVETLSLWLLSPLCLLVLDLDGTLRASLWAFFAGGGILGTIVALALMGSRRRGSRAEGSRGAAGWRRSLEAAWRMARPASVARALAWSSAQDLSDIAMVACIARSLDLSMGFAACLLVYLAVNLASLLPATPGQIGLIESGAVLALTALGTSQTEALAAALLYHAAHLVPLTLAGAVPLMRLKLWRAPEVGAP